MFVDYDDCKRLIREIQLLKAFNDTNYVTKILDILEPTRHYSGIDSNEEHLTLYLVMELVDTDLKKLIKSPVCLTEVHIKVITYNILCALFIIQKAGVMHRDIKPSNILID